MALFKFMLETSGGWAITNEKISVMDLRCCLVTFLVFELVKARGLSVCPKMVTKRLNHKEVANECLLRGLKKSQDALALNQPHSNPPQ